jgi:hypothetical protein
MPIFYNKIGLVGEAAKIITRGGGGGKFSLKGTKKLQFKSPMNVLKGSPNIKKNIRVDIDNQF